MDLEELAKTVGETPRQIRYLIAGDFIPAAGGSRARPHYGEEHVSAIRRYQELREVYKPAQIKALMDKERAAAKVVDVVLGPGVRLIIDPAELPPGVIPDDVLREFFKNQSRKENPDAA